MIVGFLAKAHGRFPTDGPDAWLCRMYECTLSALQVSNVASAVEACSICLLAVRQNVSWR